MNGEGENQVADVTEAAEPTEKQVEGSSKPSVKKASVKK